MWRALRAELTYLGPILLIAWSIAFAVALMTMIMARVAGGDGPPVYVATALPGFFPIIASMVVTFIALGYRSDEKRMCLLLAGPMTPRQLAGVMVLLPACLVCLGIGIGSLGTMVASLVTGGVDPRSVGIVVSISGQLLAIVQLGPLAQESSAAWRQQRPRASITGWAVFLLVILLLTKSTWFAEARFGYAGQLLAALVAALTAATMFGGRTDFTR